MPSNEENAKAIAANEAMIQGFRQVKEAAQAASESLNRAADVGDLKERILAWQDATIRLRQTEALLRRIANNRDYCPFCGDLNPSGCHDRDCDLANFLRGWHPDHPPEKTG